MCEPYGAVYEKLPFPLAGRSFYRQCFDPDNRNRNNAGYLPGWAYYWGKPEPLNPSRLLIAPASFEVEEEEPEPREDAKARSSSTCSTYSELFEVDKTGSISLPSSEGSVNTYTSASHNDPSDTPMKTCLHKGRAVGRLSRASRDALEKLVAQFCVDLEPAHSDLQSDCGPAIRPSFKKMRASEKSFMDLPGEIRNRVYELAFVKSVDFEIVWLSKGRDLTHYRYKTRLGRLDKDVMWGRLRPDRDDPEFGGLFYSALLNPDATKKRRKEVWATAAEKRAVVAQTTKVKKSLSSKNGKVGRGRLLRTKAVENMQKQRYQFNLEVRGFRSLLCLNRQIHDEAASMFYSRNTFSFGTRTLMLKFLQSLTPIARLNICNIRLVHDTPNIPLMKKDMYVVEKDNRNLVKALEYLSSHCISLSNLQILTTIRGSFLQLSLHDTWAQNLTSGLKSLKNLPHLETFDLDLILGGDTSNVAAVAVEIPRDDNSIARATQLVDAADMVRRKVLGEEKFRQLGTKGAQKQKLKTKVLRIVA